MLGEGEVSIQVAGTPAYRIQESVFTGLWRCCELDAGGALRRDWLEAAPVPRVALDRGRAAARRRRCPVELPPGAMNSPALLNEIACQLAERPPGARAHVVNLTLFPMTPDDHAVLERALPVGPVAMISRGFGNCRITSTSARDVWRVQYFNNMNTLILNTIEVVDVPEVALASAEDLVDSRTRLAELVTWMSESVAEAGAGLTAWPASRVSVTPGTATRGRASSAGSAGTSTNPPKATPSGRSHRERRSRSCRRTGPARTARRRRRSSSCCPMTEAPPLLPDPSARLAAVFQAVAERMRGLDFVNPALEVEAVGFAPGKTTGWA